MQARAELAEIQQCFLTDEGQTFDNVEVIASLGHQNLSPPVQFMPPGLVWRAGVKGVVPLAAAIGISLTPSRYLLARVAGGVVLATAANVGRQAAMATKKRQAPKALLGLLRREGVDEVTREQVGAICHHPTSVSFLCAVRRVEGDHQDYSKSYTVFNSLRLLSMHSLLLPLEAPRPFPAITCLFPCSAIAAASSIPSTPG